jgi:UDP-N-acetylmuramoyl-tripeptide--D-alanyl-D-alanine ligase
MKTLTLEEVISAVRGRPLGAPPVTGVRSVCTDSRTLQSEELFFALRGERFDGHDFVDAALERGATAAVVSDLARIPERWQESGRLILVDDVCDALGRLAAYHRSQVAAQVIVVVGSNGKTTTKNMIEAVLRTRKQGRASPKSYNNHIGVPLTLLSIEAADEFVVVEIGTNHPGEVARLAEMCRPDMGVVTSIGEEHLEFFGDLAAVAQEEFSLVRHIRPRGLVVAHVECAEHPALSSRSDLTCVTFGLEPGADLRATDLTCDDRQQRFLVNGRFEYVLPLLGEHNVSNALAAVALGLRFGLEHDEIARALASIECPPMRLERQQVGGLTLINDAYNANPASMRAALAVLEQLRDPGRRVLVFGDMRELGEHSERLHEELGRAAGRCGAHVIVAIGAHSRNVADGATSTGGPHKRIFAFPSVETAGPLFKKIVEPGDLVLLKGSRGLCLERLIPFLQIEPATVGA